ARERVSPLIEQQRGRALPARGEDRPAPHEIPLERVDRVLPERDDPLLTPLSEQAQRAGIQVNVVEREADRLADPGAGSVQDLHERLVPQPEGLGGGGRAVDEALDLVDRNGFREAFLRTRGLDPRRRVMVRPPLLHLEFVPPAHGDDRPRGGGGGQWVAAVGAGPEHLGVPRHDVFGHLGRAREVLRVEVAHVAGEITGIGREGLPGKAALDLQVSEVLLQRPLQRGGFTHTRTFRTGGTDRSPSRRKAPSGRRSNRGTPSSRRASYRSSLVSRAGCTSTRTRLRKVPRQRNTAN